MSRILRDLGARVSFITGPAEVPPPEGVAVIRVETARQMLESCQNALPADIFIAAAATSPSIMPLARTCA